MKTGSVKKPLAAGNRLRSARGFTLVELLIALLALTVGLLAAGAIQVVSIRGNRVSGNASTALVFATERMEDLINRSANDPLLADVRPSNNHNLSSLTDVDFEERVNDKGDVVPGGFYRRIWNVADSSPVPPLKTVTVIVTWDGNRKPVILTCIR